MRGGVCGVVLWLLGNGHVLWCVVDGWCVCVWWWCVCTVKWYITQLTKTTFDSTWSNGTRLSRYLKE